MDTTVGSCFSVAREDFRADFWPGFLNFIKHLSYLFFSSVFKLKSTFLEIIFFALGFTIFFGYTTNQSELLVTCIENEIIL